MVHIWVCEKAICLFISERGWRKWSLQTKTTKETELVTLESGQFRIA